jgi:hypothetical protein
VPVPVEFAVFRNHKGLPQFAPRWNGKPIELAGYFQPGEDRDLSRWISPQRVAGRWYSTSLPMRPATL